MRIRRGAAVGAVVLAAAAVMSPTPGSAAVQPAQVQAAAVANQGTYYKLQPARILDTREGNGAPQAALTSGQAISLQVTGRGGVPTTGVSAVVLNVTVASASGDGYLTVSPTGATRPNASSLNFRPGYVGANSVTVAVGTGGKVDIFNSLGNTHVVADVVGFYALDASVVGQFGTGGEYWPMTPERLLDSRFDWGEKLPADFYAEVGIDFGPALNPLIRAYVVNVTAVDPAGTGYLTSWDGQSVMPFTSTLNYTAGTIVPNLAVVPTAPNPDFGGAPTIGIYTNTTTHLIVDILGLFDDGSDEGLLFEPLNPVRIVDSRSNVGIQGKLGPGATRTVTTPGAVAPAETEALALNVTAVSPTANTFVTVWPEGTGSAMPTSSNLNPVPGVTVPNAVYSSIGPTKAFNVYNNAGTVDILVDVVGTFYYLAPVSAARSTGPSVRRAAVTNGTPIKAGPQNAG